MGDGFAVAPNELDVSGECARLVSHDQPLSVTGPRSTWSLFDTDLGPGYVAAIAVEGGLTREPEIRGSVAQALVSADGNVSIPSTTAELDLQGGDPAARLRNSWRASLARCGASPSCRW